MDSKLPEREEAGEGQQEGLPPSRGAACHRCRSARNREEARDPRAPPPPPPPVCTVRRREEAAAASTGAGGGGAGISGHGRNGLSGREGHPAAQWGLLLDSKCDRLPEVSTAGWSPGSGNVLL